MLLPPLAAIVLALPGFRITWIMDDFDFLARAQAMRPSFLLPDPGSVFYRPLSRELYFGLLSLVSPRSALLGHFLNAALLASCAALLVSIGSRLRGPATGLLAGLSFSALGAAPLLVAWVSGAQDLLAIALALLALTYQLDERPIPAACAWIAALLSKETAIAFLPILVALPWIVRGRPRRLLVHMLPYAALALVWSLLHPGPRFFLGAPVRTAGDESYVGIGAPGRTAFLGRTIGGLANVPLTGGETPWPSGLSGHLVVAIAIVIASSVVLADRRRPQRAALAPISVGRTLLLGGLLTVLPILPAAILVRQWAPHYAVMPAVGTSLVLGTLLARVSPLIAGLALTGFVTLGVWGRGADPQPVVLGEPYLNTVSSALVRVEAGFRTLRATFPAGAHAIVSVAGTGAQGVWTHMHRFQALRVWYRDSDLITLLPERRLAGDHLDLVFRITRDLDVIEIDPDRCLFRSSGRPPDPSQVGLTIRTYARGVAASGDFDRAVRILQRLAEFDGGGLWAYDLRLAAMIRFAQGRVMDAESLMAATGPPPRSLAIDMVGKIFSEPTRSAGVDSCAFRAFDLSSSDTSVVRHFMRMFQTSGYRDQALEFARRMERLVPGDSESAAMVRALTSLRGDVRITSPLGGDSL